LQEKLIAFCARKFVVIADWRKHSDKLGDNWRRGIPIETVPSAYRMVQETIQNRFGGRAVLRESVSKCKAVTNLLIKLFTIVLSITI
jgi:ribose 5-phosphate isomerase A